MWIIGHLCNLFFRDDTGYHAAASVAAAVTAAAVTADTRALLLMFMGRDLVALIRRGHVVSAQARHCSGGVALVVVWSERWRLATPSLVACVHRESWRFLLFQSNWSG